MRVEKNEGFLTLVFRVKELAEHHWRNEKLVREGEEFRWRPKPESGEVLATVAEIFGETEIDFADEYLLLHGSDEIKWYWEPDSEDAHSSR